MNREIKFRFIYGVDGEENTYFSKVFTFSEIENGCHWEELSDNPLYRNYSILAKHQFTGLLDKHGKPIFEGDVMDIHKGMLAVIGWNEGTAAFCAIYDGKKSDHLYAAEYSEIIGNIYENEDLLNI